MEDDDRESGLSLLACVHSPPEARPTLDSYFNALSISSEQNQSAIVKISKRSLDSGSSSEQDDDMFLKKVSFAKHSQRYPAMGVETPEKISESDQSCAYFENVPDGSMPNNGKPWFQSRPYTSPPPPRSISPTPIMKSRQTPPPRQDSTDYSLDWDENWPGNLVENYEIISHQNILLNSPSSVSPILSERSLASGSDRIKLISNTNLGAEAHSVEHDSLLASITTDYYSPLGFFYEGTFSRQSSLQQVTITRSASAPSFMICAAEEGQLSHCLLDDSTMDDFKKYLLNLSDFSCAPANCSYGADHNEENPAGIDSYSSSFKSLNKSNFSLTKRTTISRATQTSTSDSELISSPYYAESEETETELPVKCGYQDIALSELLDRIYPAVYKSSEGSMSPSLQNHNQVKSSEDSISPSPLQQSCYKSSEDSIPPSPLHHHYFKPSDSSISSSPNHLNHLKISEDSSISPSPLYHSQFKSQEEDSTSPSQRHHSHFKFAGLVIRNNHDLELPVISNSHQQTSCSSTAVGTTATKPNDLNQLSQGSAEPLPDPEESLDVSSLYSATNVPSTLMLHKSDSESSDSENHSDTSSSCCSGDTSLGQTYSLHGSDNSSFTIPSLPLDCIQSSPHTASVSAASTPASTAGNTALEEENSEKESADTSSELPSTAGSNDDNYDSVFNPKQGSSSDYYSECLSQPNASLINDSADMSMMTIPSLPFGGCYGARSSGDGTSLNTTNDSIAALMPPSPIVEPEDDKEKSAELFTMQADLAGNAVAVPTSETSKDYESSKTVSLVDTQDKSKSITITIPSDMLREENVGGAASEPTFKALYLNRTPKGSVISLQVPPPAYTSDASSSGSKSEASTSGPSDIVVRGENEGGATRSEPALKALNFNKKSEGGAISLQVPPPAYTSDTSPYVLQNMSSRAKSEAVASSSTSIHAKTINRIVESTGSENSSSDVLSAKDGSDNQIPSLSLKITAWTSDRESDVEKLHKIASTPAKLTADTENNPFKKTNAVAITVMETPKIICDGSSTSGYSEGSPASSSLNASLKYVTELLESSHNSLAKAVQSLSEKAPIKQSNISLELILPLKDYEKPENKTKLESHLAKLQLNSSTFYTTEEKEDAGFEEGESYEKLNNQTKNHLECSSEAAERAGVQDKYASIKLSTDITENSGILQ